MTDASLASASRLRLATAQLNPVVGDIKGNAALVRAARAEAAHLRDPAARADLMRLILDGLAAAR